MTREEELAFKTLAAERGTNVSTLARDLLLAELARREGSVNLDPGAELLELFKRTMKLSLRYGEAFTEAEFDRLCEEVKAHGDG
ncbi:MAG: hypothetical protein ACR2JB_03735 [Bryobacteraceae bacterium]